MTVSIKKVNGEEFFISKLKICTSKMEKRSKTSVLNVVLTLNYSLSPKILNK